MRSVTLLCGVLCSVVPALGAGECNTCPPVPGAVCCAQGQFCYSPNGTGTPCCDCGNVNSCACPSQPGTPTPAPGPTPPVPTPPPGPTPPSPTPTPPTPPTPPAPTPPPGPTPAGPLTPIPGSEPKKWKGISYGPLPNKTGDFNVRNDDMMTTWFQAQWGNRKDGGAVAGDDRDDFGVMKAMGADTIRMYGNDATESHKDMLDHAEAVGVGIVAGNGNQFRFGQDSSCYTQASGYDCHDTIKKHYQLNLDNGFLKERCTFAAGGDFQCDGSGTCTSQWDNWKEGAANEDECCGACARRGPDCVHAVFVGAPDYQCYFKLGTGWYATNTGGAAKACSVNARANGGAYKGEYRNALTAFSISNEPDLFATGKELARGMLSALDGLVAAEHEASVDPDTAMRLTVTYSFSTCTSRSPRYTSACLTIADGTVSENIPSVPFMADLARAVKDPSLVGYTPRSALSDIQYAFRKRWVHSFNTNSPWQNIRDQFFDGAFSPPEPAYLQVAETKDYPVFVLEYHQKELGNVTDPNYPSALTFQEDLQMAQTKLVDSPDYPLYGLSIFQYQIAYAKCPLQGQCFELEFGIFGLGNDMLKMTDPVGDSKDGKGPPITYPVWCIRDGDPELDKGCQDGAGPGCFQICSTSYQGCHPRGLPDAITQVWGGDGTWKSKMCK